MHSCVYAPIVNTRVATKAHAAGYVDSTPARNLCGVERWLRMAGLVDGLLG